MKEYNQEVTIVFNEKNDFEKQLQKIKEMNEHFIDIATTFHIKKINEKQDND